MNIKDLHKGLSELSDTPPMPIIFVGHGTPMNALENNIFTQSWIKSLENTPIPRAIICISAHWETRGTYITIIEKPKTIHDFYGFPPELYAQKYPAEGNPKLAEEIIKESKNIEILPDEVWGLDHGTWSVLKHMYPCADIPVLQISIDHYKDMEWHYEFAKTLAYLRSRGVLIIGSGNVIHNLRMMTIKGDDFNAEYGYDWAYEIEKIMVNKIKNNDLAALIDYQHLHKDIRLAIPTPEHYIPLLYTLGLKNEESTLNIFNNTIVAGSLDMLSLLITD